jgi:hypothetical protein
MIAEPPGRVELRRRDGRGEILCSVRCEHALCKVEENAAVRGAGTARRDSTSNSQRIDKRVDVVRRKRTTTAWERRVKIATGKLDDKPRRKIDDQFQLQARQARPLEK